jgi:site-specific DNA-methyltransferase (adenine-specific)
MNGKDTVLFSKASDEWTTPQWLFDLLDKEFQFDFDAAANDYNTKCGDCWLQNALEDSWMQWKGVKFFLNPPYSKIGAFMKKAYEESQKGAVVVCLIPSRTDTKYWHDYVMKAQEIRFVKGRLKFGDQKNSAPFPSVIVIFDPHYYKSHIILTPVMPRIGKTISRGNEV